MPTPPSVILKIEPPVPTLKLSVPSVIAILPTLKSP